MVTYHFFKSYKLFVSSEIMGTPLLFPIGVNHSLSLKEHSPRTYGNTVLTNFLKNENLQTSVFLTLIKVLLLDKVYYAVDEYL